MKRYLVLALLVLLPACSTSGGKSPMMAAGASGAVEADIACTRRCNRGFRVCEDSVAVRRPDGGGGFGMAAQCQRELATCFKSCQPASPSLKPGATASGKAISSMQP
ncbi:MAG TPA: hypothetical protein VEB64_11530 [Azospirillaceae bacterium]|nr:hypothetical protein [Azospirillaceae bacterium]